MDIKALIENRRSLRTLKPFTVDEALIHQLAQAAIKSPSCMNNQPAKYLFIYEKLALEKAFSALSEGNKWAKKASLIIAVISRRDNDCVMPDGRAYYQYDTGLSAGFLILMGTELGLVMHPIAGYDPVKMKELFNIPDPYEVINLIITGKISEEIDPDLNEKQKEHEKTRPKRKDCKEFVYLNNFTD